MKVPAQSPAPSPSPLDQFADGMTDRAVETVVATLNLPQDLLNYLLGADRHWGERRSFFSNIGMNYASEWDPIGRVVHVTNSFVFGGLNFVTFGGLHDHLDCLREFLAMVHMPLSNDLLGTLTSYMTPMARTPYEMGGTGVDALVLLTGARAGMEYNAWRRPIAHRAAIVAEAQLAVLQEAALRVPDVMVKGIDRLLAEGNRAMQILDEMAPQSPQVADWMKSAAPATTFANAMISGHIGAVEAFKFRLSVLYRYNPQAVIDALQEAVFYEWKIQEGPKAGQVLEYAATPHFELLRGWEVDAAVRPQIAQVYATIALNTEVLPVAIHASDGLLRMGAEAEHYAATLLRDPRPMVKYAMMRAALTRGLPLSPEISALLRDIPVMDDLILLGREYGTGPATQILRGWVDHGNPHALQAMEMMVETAHAYALQAIAVLRRLRETQIDSAGRISRFLREADINVVENDVIFCVGDRDVALGTDNARILVELAKEGNGHAKAALLRLTEHENVKVRDIGAQCLVDMTLEGTLPHSQMALMLAERHPRLLSMVEYWTVKDPVSLSFDISLYGEALGQASELSSGAVHVLQTQARYGNAEVGAVVSRLAVVFPDRARDLVQILISHRAVRASVDWPQLSRVAESHRTDVEFPLQVVRLMSEEPGGRSVMTSYNPFWFSTVCNGGESMGVAGLELLALQGNAQAVEYLYQIARRKSDRQSVVNMPYLAQEALRNVQRAKVVADGLPQEKPAAAPLPTMAAMLTDLDLQTGRAASLAAEVLSGRRMVQSLADLEVLRLGVEKSADGALSAIYKTAWEQGEFAAEARDLLIQWDETPVAPHHHTVGIMLRVLADRPGVSPVNHAAVTSPGRSLRYLETLISVSPDRAPMALDELMRAVKVHPDNARASVLRLMDSSNPRVVDLVSDRLVQAAESGDIHITFLRLILQMDQSHAAKLALSSRLRFHLDTALRSTPLEGLRALL